MARVKTGCALRPILETLDTEERVSMSAKGLHEGKPYTWPQLKEVTYDAE